MAEHSASVIVRAPVHQVYQLYTHFNDYPKFMTFVHEVTYLDGERSHWVVDVAGRHEWDAVNENWTPDRQIGWRSVDGVANSGRVTFEPAGPSATRVTVDVRYDPPAGLLGNIGEILGVGGQFDRRLQHDLQHFATMVEQAPPGALDPTSSAYLFHSDSAAARGATTVAQDDSMGMSGDKPPGDVATPGDTTPSTSEVTATSDQAVPLVPGTSPGRELR